MRVSIFGKNVSRVLSTASPFHFLITQDLINVYTSGLFSDAVSTNYVVCNGRVISNEVGIM